MNAEEFDRQLRHLARFWRVVSLEDAVRALQAGSPLPRNSVVITFDDGYRSNYSTALPLLEKHNLPATVFVVSGAVDGKPLWFDQVDAWLRATPIKKLRFSRIDSELDLTTAESRKEAARQVFASLKAAADADFGAALNELRSKLQINEPDQQPAEAAILSWAELRQMSDNRLVTIGAHTVTHRILTHLADQDVQREITESCSRIGEQLQRNIGCFAYPNGDYDSRAQSVVRDLGLIGCGAGGNGFNPPGVDVTALNRLGAEGLSFYNFARHLAGWKDIRKAVVRKALAGELASWFRQAKRGAYFILELAGFFPLLRFVNRTRLTVLLYHSVTNRTSSAHLDDLHVPARTFRKQMAWLRRKYTPVSLEQVVAALDNQRPLPRRPLLVTFDDAYRNNWQVAWPILKEFGIPMTLFVPTDFVEKQVSYWADDLDSLLSSTATLCVPWRGDVLWLWTAREREESFKILSDDLKTYTPEDRDRALGELRYQLGSKSRDASDVEPRLTWEELREFSKQEGVSIGSHGVSHSTLPDLPPENVKFELEESKRKLESQLGIKATAFAYSGGAWSIDVRNLTELAGYNCAFTGHPGTNGREVNRFLLNRIGINATDSSSEFVSAVSSFSRLRSHSSPRILEIGNYPPPQCGWAMQTKLLTEELRRHGAACEVLNINESRKLKSPEYVDVQNGPDYLLKVIGFALRGYRPHTHVNAQSWEGYVLTMIANLAGRAVGRPAVMTFHGGASQRFFPRPDSYLLTLAYRLLFLSAGSVTCDSIEIEHAVKSYGTTRRPVFSVPCFSRQNLSFQQQVLAPDIEAFLQQRTPVFFCFLCFRPEYAIDSLLPGMNQFSQQYPRAGFIWLGFPAKEMSELQSFLSSLPGGKPENLLVLGNLDHDTFLTLLSRCFAYLRPHYRDGVSASVLESLAMGIPVIAAENGMRPSGVVSYDWRDANDLYSKLVHVVQNYEQVKAGLEQQDSDDNIERVAQWLLMTERGTEKLIHAAAGQSQTLDLRASQADARLSRN
jgi:peptidoglycan/xylan/chitin deacetylase (PgdA/CDA1 family)/glycosyltransferase involved in cell wall biosynthesis